MTPDADVSTISATDGWGFDGAGCGAADATATGAGVSFG